MDISSTFNKLLDVGINKKNCFIVIPMIICAVLYVLGVDINIIYNFSFTNTILLICLCIYELIVGCLIFCKIDDCGGENSRCNMVLDVVTKINNDNENLKSKIDDIDSNIIQHDKRFIATTADLTNKPNIKSINLLVNAYVKNMFNDIFEECLNYTLLVNEYNTEIALENLKGNIYGYIKDQLNEIHELIKTFDTNEQLSTIIKTKTTDMIDVICNDIQKNKKINEKLYYTNLVLRETRKDIKKVVTDYIRELQTKLF